jgi:hypothetical protein
MFEIPLTLEIVISERKITEPKTITILRKELIPIQVELPDWVKEIPEASQDIIVIIEVKGKYIMLRGK